ncbi:ATPase domain-containing protein [Sinorhizobium meliloti]|uniref:ATPase domain-containing protein n=1 Tax=Rhizobium meliloti TaxID=382 RepID=UPI002E141B0E
MKTGIAAFDDLMMGGLPRRRTTIVAGTPGSGKTVFATQFLSQGIMELDESGVFVTFEESPSEIEANMSTFGWEIGRWLLEEDWDILESLLEEWSATTGAVLHELGDTVRFAYFPRGSSLISYFVVLSEGRAVETALIGREGAAGGIVSQGRLPAFTRAEVQVGGPFYRIELNSLEGAKKRSPTLRHLFARYADCLMAQIFQAIACNAVHSLEQGTVKWLLAAIERTGTVDRSYPGAALGDAGRGAQLSQPHHT